MAESDRRGVFVGWSKPIALAIAQKLKPFLEDVLGTATIFMSQAMEGGARWSVEIPQRLEACNAGLVLVTKENSHEPWLHFEAGALSKRVDESHVVPLLCGTSVGDIQGTPLSMFQAKALERDAFLDVCVQFGRVFDIPEEAIRRRYEKSWPDLEEAVVRAGKATGTPQRPLELADLMAVTERLVSQVSMIESSVRYAGPTFVDPVTNYARGMFGNPISYSADSPTMGQLWIQSQIDPTLKAEIGDILLSRFNQTKKGEPREEEPKNNSQEQ